MNRNNLDSSRFLNLCGFKEKFENVKVQEHPNEVLTTVTKPKVSILLVTYQHVDYIEKAINSIITQKTEYSYEIILGDDDSTDGTREICLDYANKHPDKIRFFLHKRENNINVEGSPSVLFQFAYNLFLCRGEYVAILSGDDFWIDKFKLQKQVDYLEENPHHSMVCTNYSIVNEKNELIKEDGWGREIKNGFIDHLTILKSFKPKTQTTLTRASSIPNKLPIEFFNCINEDNFFCALVSKNKSVGYLDYVSTAYRVHNKSIWSGADLISQLYMQLNTFQNMKKVFRKNEQQIAIDARIKSIKRQLCLGYATNKKLIKSYKLFFEDFNINYQSMKYFLKINVMYIFSFFK